MYSEGSEGKYRWLSVTENQKHGPIFSSSHPAVQKTITEQVKQKETRKTRAAKALAVAKVRVMGDLNTKNHIIDHIVAVLSSSDSKRH
jgi:hypothetical protein